MSSQTRFAVRHTPGTAMAKRFGTTPSPLHFHTADGAEQMRTACSHSDQRDVVEVSR